ncbi:MAG: hypothetical protein ACOYOV_16385 [Bacteroidales bacterium]
MIIAALIIYVIFAFIVGPFWPLEAISGKGGPIGVILGLVWLGLLIAGFVS